ncbi:CMRF35-like molecule 9 [Trichechus manatus latirostris]|uniref:CMRF35-like molecule 9 n=1 Tax=Trichechus manatus latirostris TaxID=127582 RepID=A0A2Y9DHX8_TRIMA|nr:CMRF35-like molecule 9 [Trichechus manatus latirostris]
MWLLLLWGCLLLPGSTALEGPKEISGFEGDTVSVRCSYREKLKRNQKYWCRMGGIFISRCSGTIYAGEDGQEVASGRVSIRDSLQEQAFTVTLRNLTLGDDGKYWCGVTRLGFDETLLVTLVVFPGPCCPPSPPPRFQPLATRSFQPKAKARQTQPPELTSPGLHLRVTTAKQGKTGAEAPPYTETSLYPHTGHSLYTGASHAVTSPHAATSPHAETSPHAGSSLLATQLDSTSAKGTSPIPSSSSSKSRVSIPMVRMLAPVLVLLALLLATGLAGLGSHVLRWKKEGEQGSLAMETEKNQKVHLPHLTSEEEEPSSQNPKGDSIPVPPHHLSGDKLFHSEFLPV